MLRLLYPASFCGLVPVLCSSRLLPMSWLGAGGPTLTGGCEESGAFSVFLALRTFFGALNSLTVLSLRCARSYIYLLRFPWCISVGSFPGPDAAVFFGRGAFADVVLIVRFRTHRTGGLGLVCFWAVVSVERCLTIAPPCPVWIRVFPSFPFGAGRCAVLLFAWDMSALCFDSDIFWVLVSGVLRAFIVYSTSCGVCFASFRLRSDGSLVFLLMTLPRYSYFLDWSRSWLWVSFFAPLASLLFPRVEPTLCRL